MKAPCHHLQPREMSLHLPCQCVWKTQLPPKLQLFLWKGLLGKLLTNDYLARFLPNISSLCPLCPINRKVLTIYLVGARHITRLIWGMMPGKIVNPTTYPSFAQWFWSSHNTHHISVGVTVAWHTRKMRNESMFQLHPIHPGLVKKIKKQVIYALYEWSLSHIIHPSMSFAGTSMG